MLIPLVVGSLHQFGDSLPDPLDRPLVHRLLAGKFVEPGIDDPGVGRPLDGVPAGGSRVGDRQAGRDHEERGDDGRPGGGPLPAPADGPDEGMLRGPIGPRADAGARRGEPRLEAERLLQPDAGRGRGLEPITAAPPGDDRAGGEREGDARPDEAGVTAAEPRVEHGERADEPDGDRPGEPAGEPPAEVDLAGQPGDGGLPEGGRLGVDLGGDRVAATAGLRGPG